MQFDLKTRLALFFNLIEIYYEIFAVVLIQGHQTN